MFIQFADKQQITTSTYLSALFFSYLEMLNDPFSVDDEKVVSEGAFYIENDSIMFASGSPETVSNELGDDLSRIHLRIKKEEAVASSVDFCGDDIFMVIVEQALRQVFENKVDMQFQSTVQAYAQHDEEIVGLVEKLLNKEQEQVVLH